MPFKDPEARRAYVRQHYLENRELYKSRAAANYAENRDAALKGKKEYYERNKLRFREWQLAWRQANKIAVKQWYKQYRKERPTMDKDRYKRDKARIDARGKRYKASHPEVVAKNYQRHKDAYIIRAKLRRGRLLNAVGSFTAKDVCDLWDSQMHKCAVPKCGHPIAATGKYKYHLDHIKALINGGNNLSANLQILCRHHNCSKGAKDEKEWALKHGVEINKEYVDEK